MDVPETNYAQSGDARIAYQVVGDGPFDIVFAPPQITHLELLWKVRPWAAFNERLAKLGRLIIFDKRGTGMSDRAVGIADIETRMDDLRAVMDAAGSERAALFGTSEGGTLAALFAATYPERVWAVVLWGSMPRYRWARDYRGGRTEEEEREIEEYWRGRAWPDPEHLGAMTDWLIPGAGPSDRQAMINMLAAGAEADEYRAIVAMNMAMDIRAALPAISAPTLVIYREEEPDQILYGSRTLADLIPGALEVKLPGQGHFPFAGDSAAALAQVEDFLVRSWGGTPPTPEFDRLLATILFTDVVGSTRALAKVGDRAWRQLLTRHHALIRLQLARYRGIELDTAGDGFFARFDGPVRAITCADEITRAVRALGIEVRAGIHTGECELFEGKVGGIAVHIGARVASRAAAGEVLVSQTVRDLVAGSALLFEDRGVAELKGVPGDLRLYAFAGRA